MRTNLVLFVVVAAASLPLNLAIGQSRRGSSDDDLGVRSVTNPQGEPISYDCLVSLIKETHIPSEEAGVLSKILVREGEPTYETVEQEQADGTIKKVRRPRILAQIDDRMPKRQREVALLNWRKAKEAAENDINEVYARKAAELAEVSHERAEYANRQVKGTFPEIEVRRLKLDAERAGLQIKQAVMEQTLAKWDLAISREEYYAAEDSIKRRKLTSPIDGVVTAVFSNEGEWVKAGDPVMRIIQMNRLRVEGFLNIHKVAPHKVKGRKVSVEVRLSDDPSAKPRVFTGRINFVHPEIQSGGEYRVWAEVENPPTDEGHYLLLPGMVATMTVHTKQPVVDLAKSDAVKK